jgi:DNA-binding CsgD family transcriptional regulator
VLRQCLHARTAPGADELAAHRARIGLVEQLSKRPRRFLLRLALGHSYREIATDERVSVSTASKQIAGAKRLLRAADSDASARPRGRRTRVASALTASE